MKNQAGLPKTLDVTEAISKVVDKVIRAALQYERVINCGRKLGITGEVGEILVCRALCLKLVENPRAEGYDAVDKDGCHVQIKTRRSEREELPKDTGRVSKFSDHAFRYALLGILDRNYTLVEVWKADSARLKSVIRKHKNANPPIGQFKKVATRVYHNP